MKTVRTNPLTNRGRKPKCKTSCVINPAGIMRAPSATTKKFGKGWAPNIFPLNRSARCFFCVGHSGNSKANFRCFKPVWPISVRLSWQQAYDLGFRGDLGVWERLSGAARRAQRSGLTTDRFRPSRTRHARDMVYLPRTHRRRRWSSASARESRTSPTPPHQDPAVGQQYRS